MAYKQRSPIAIAEGGTNATTMATTDGVAYYDGTRLVTTAAGAATQVLTSNGAGVAPTFQDAGGGGGGSYVLIQTLTATADTELDFTTGISSTYNNYVIICDSMINPNVGGFTRLLVQLSTDGGLTYETTGYVGNETNGFIAGQFLSTTSFGNSTTWLYNLTSGANYCQSICENTAYDPGDGTNNPSQNGNTYTTASTTVNALRVTSDDGTAFSGTASLYGIAK